MEQNEKGKSTFASHLLTLFFLPLVGFLLLFSCSFVIFYHSTFRLENKRKSLNIMQQHRKM